MKNAIATLSVRSQSLLQHVISAEQYDFWMRQMGLIEAWSRCFARVVAVAQTTPDGVVLSLKPNRHQRRLITGPRCAVSVEVAGRNIARSFVWSNSEDGRYMQVSISRQAADPVSRQLLEDTAVGDIVELLPASGDSPPPTLDARSVAPDTALVYLRRSEKTVSVTRGTSLLEALELAGVKPTYGCRRGICNRCSCTRIQGQTTDMVSGESSDEPGHSVRICINRASSDLELDL